MKFQLQSGPRTLCVPCLIQLVTYGLWFGGFFNFNNHKRLRGELGEGGNTSNIREKKAHKQGKKEHYVRFTARNRKKLGFSSNIFHSFALRTRDLELLCFLLSYLLNFLSKPKQFSLAVSVSIIKNSKIKQFPALWAKLRNSSIIT